ncbi:MAG: nuclear transport factor 2 family protein [Candidatus Limnocylindrales bacterium]|nr:nuclear transport factor 2 family protein [Candidatus Limnocylindrales bacterium]
MIDYAAAGDLLAAYRRAWENLDGDAWVAIFSDDAEYHEDPFGVPLVGHNALRAYLLDVSASQRDVEFTVERHWVSGTTVLAAWRAAFTRRATGRFVRMAGFMTAEVAPDGRIARFREWTRYGPEGRG